MYVGVPHLRYVVAAAEHRSFRRAAAALNITQPTLSKRIRELEVRLGVPLFVRSTGGTRPTAVGRDFIATARRVLSDLSFMENQAKAAKKGDAGQLDIGHYTSLSTGPLRDAIVMFTTLHLWSMSISTHIPVPIFCRYSIVVRSTSPSCSARLSDGTLTT